MTDVGKLVIDMSAKVDKLNRGFDTAKSRVQDFGKRTVAAGKNVRRAGMQMTMAGAAIVAPFAIATKKASDFEAGMREVNTMMGLGQKEFTTFSDDVRGMARRLGIDAVESTQALYQAISAGVPKENVLEFMEVASKAAIGGVTDTATAVDGLTTIVNAFGLEIDGADRVADAMFATVKGGKTTMEELSDSISTAAPLAATLGMEFEDVLAATATLTKQGVPTAEAMTQIRGALVALTKPSSEMERLFNKLGYESGEALLQANGFAGSMQLLRDAAGDNNKVLAEAFGRVQGLNAALAVSGDNAESAAESYDSVTNSTGASQDAFEEMEKSVSRQSARMKSQLNDIAITIGNILLPIVNDLMERFSGVADRVSEWIAENQKLVSVLVTMVAGLGALLVVLGPITALVGQLMILTGGLIKIGPPLITVLKGVAVGIKAVSLALGAKIALVGAAVYAVVKLFNTLKKADKALDDLSDTQKRQAKLQKEVSDMMRTGIEGWKKYGDESVDALKKQGVSAEEAKKIAQGLRVTESRMREEGYKEDADQWRKRAKLYQEYYEGRKDAQEKEREYTRENQENEIEDYQEHLDLLEEMDDLEMEKYLERLELQNEEYANMLRKQLKDQEEAGEEKVTAAQKEAQRITAIWDKATDNIARSIESNMVDAFVGGMAAMGDANKKFSETILDTMQQMFAALYNQLATAVVQHVAGEKIKAIASTIASVISSIPFPLNLALVGGAIAATKALFSGLTSFAKGGMAIGPQLAIVGDNPGKREAIIPSEMFDKMGGGGSTIIHFKQELNVDELSPETPESMFFRLAEATKEGINEAQEFAKRNGELYKRVEGQA